MMPGRADKVISTLSAMSEREALFEIVKQNDHRKWSAIRNIYKTVDVSSYVPYVVDWMVIFSPIERMAWGEIRDYGLPFFPQFPVGKFFADFADPVKKIVIECDGKEFHDQSRDADRDAQMNLDGWKVFRISGSDCNRLIDDPWEKIDYLEAEGDQSKASQLLSDLAHRTVDGLIWALHVSFYDGCAQGYKRLIASSVITERRSY